MKFIKKFENSSKRILLRYISNLFKKKQLTGNDIPQIKNVIIVRIDERIGNLVLILPVVNSFIKNRVSVTVMAAGKFADIIRTKKGVKVIEFNKKKFFNPLYILKFIFTIRKHRYDLLFDASNPNDMSTLTFLTIAIINAKVKFGFDRKNSSSVLNLTVKPPKREIHILEYYRILFNTLGIKFYSELKLNLDDKIKNRHKSLLKRKKRLIAVHPGGRGPKQWDITKLLELLQNIKNKKFEFLIIIGPNEKENRLFFEKVGYNVVEPKDVIDLASYLSLCDIFIGNDSGPMHLAASLGLKIVAIFRDSAKINFRPVAKKYEIISAYDVNTISVKRVYKAFQKII